MATLEGWARPTDFLFLEHVPGGADHTYVVSSGGARWKCGGGDEGGNSGSEGGRLIVSGDGSHTLAKKLARNDYGGMSVYGAMGVCHQMANRVLYPCGRNVHRAKGAGWSYTIYGIYGRPHAAWLAWKAACEAETGRLPLPYGIPMVARPQSPRWPRFAMNPSLDLAVVAETADIALRTNAVPEMLEFSEDEWQDREMLSVALLSEAAGASPDEIEDAEFESFLKVRSDGKISDEAIQGVFDVRSDIKSQLGKLFEAFMNGEKTKDDFLKYYCRLMVAEFSSIEKSLGPSLYEQIYDLPPDHSPAILNPDALERAE